MEKSIGEKNEEETDHRDAAYEDQAAQGLKSDDDEKEKEKEHKPENNIAEEQMPHEEMETESLPNNEVENVQRNKRKMEDEEDQTELTARVKRDTTEKRGQDETTGGTIVDDEFSDMETEIIQSLRRMSIDVIEMYSAPRVTTEAKKFGMMVVEAMDITTGWDFNKEDDKNKAMEYINKYKPKLIIGSPMCRMFSPLQRLSPWNPEKERRWREDRGHLKFMVSVYQHQVEHGQWFIHEHSAGASLKEIQKRLNLKEVDMVKG